MVEQDFDLVDALEIAMAAEQAAAARYAEAALKTENSFGRELFEQLAAFERDHYRRLTELAESLRGKGAFAEHEDHTHELSLPVAAEGGGFEEPNRMSIMAIITIARDAEIEAANRYTELSTRTSDRAARALLRKLAEEEKQHYRTLSDVYWSLNDYGTWVRPRKEGK